MSGKSGANQGNVLVVYYTVSGNTARVAQDIAKRMHADVERLRDARHGTGCMGYLAAVIDAVRQKPVDLGPLSKNPRDYALTVIGTPVWAWKMTPAVRAYLQRVRPNLRRVAFFVTSGDTDVSKIAPSMEEVAGSKAVASAGFNAKELAAWEVYDAKLTAFVEAMANSPEVGMERDSPDTAVPAR